MEIGELFMAHAAFQLHDLTFEQPTPQMPTVPPELFRRRMTARILEDAEGAINKLEQALLADTAAAATAARYHIAAQVMGILHREDLMQDFLRLRNESIRQAQSLEPMRHREKRKPKLDGK